MNGCESIAVLMTCHNRRELTLRCLRLLMPQLRLEDRVYLVDDGSRDGTAAVVVGLNDKRLNVINGNGWLYWAKGMRKAWEMALVEKKEDWDAYLWLNDDTELNCDALKRLLAVNDGEKIVVGGLEDASGKVVYGVRANGLFTGNCVFVPRKVYERIGMICGDYSHAWADSDYAMRAKRAGIEIVDAGIVGTAEGHPNRPSLKGKSLLERLALLRNPKGWNLHDLWLYRRRNWGYCAAICSCLHLILYVAWGER